ncbi:MAG: hypothetical protein ACOYXW_04310 [Actinomycetota bacterium]
MSDRALCADFGSIVEANMQCSHATGHNSLGWTKKLDPRVGNG